MAAKLRGVKGNCTKLERFNGTGWDRVSERVSMSGPALTRETVEEDLVIDCAPTGGNPFKQKSPGTKEIGDISVEIKWNPIVPTGTNQVIRATAAGIVSAGGNALVTITTAGMAGSPLALNVPVTPGSPGSWVGEIRDYLNNNAAAAAVRAVWEILPANGSFLELKKHTPGTNDLTANIALATGTATGITSAPTSTITAAGVAGTENDENHHLFLDDFDNETATFWRIVHPNDQVTGTLVHATVKEVGEAEYAANETVKRTIVIEPTGKFYKHGNQITAEVLPVDIVAPQDHYGHH